MRRLMKSLEMLTLKCGTDSGFYPFPSALSQPSCRASGAVHVCDAAPEKKKADCHCASHVCDLWKKEEISKKTNNIWSPARVRNQQSMCCYSAIVLKNNLYFSDPNFVLFQIHSFCIVCSAPLLFTFTFFCSPHASIFGSPTD